MVHIERNKTLDATKYILICLVVIGHFIEPTRYTDNITQHLYCFIYSFHMPLFVFISGYLYKRCDIRKEISKCVPLLETCIIAHIGFYLIRFKGHISLHQFFIFAYDPTWYLLSLIYWRLGTNLFLKKVKAKHLLIISIIVDLLSFSFIKYGGVMSIGRTLAFYPFFMLGYCFKDNIKLIQAYRNTIIILGLTAITFVLVTASELQFKIEYQKENVFSLSQYTNLSIYQIYIYRYLLLLCSLSISALLLTIVESTLFIQRLSSFGKSTLFIYYAHTFIFAFISTTSISLWQSIIISVITIPVLTYISKFTIAKYLVNPIYSSINK